MTIAIEGVDASGKRTQAELLKAKVLSLGLSAVVVSFPRYEATFFGKSIGEYLNGKFGSLEVVPAHFAAMLYAGDRLESRNLIEEYTATFDVVIYDRYVASNIAYQSAKFEGDERREFISWVAIMEYEIYRLPRAEVTLLLDVPVEISSELLIKKSIRSYTDQVADLHEKDQSYLNRCRDVYLSLFENALYSNWIKINCVGKEGELRDAATISESIWQSVEGHMPVSI
jgi:dTMP kinase